MVNKLEYPRKAGIYKFTCKNNGKVYIGKSVNIRVRINRHKRDANQFKTDGLFQRALIKHGWDSFDIDILEIVEPFDKLKDKDMLLEKETQYMKLFNSTDRSLGYNICEYSNDRTGHKCSEETKQKMSKARTGYKCSEETKEKMRNRVYSDETREKMRQSKLGNKVSNETRERMRQSRLGYKMTDETKEKMKRINTGRKFSDEHKEKLSQAKRGRVFSDEHREKLSHARKGKRMSEETKEKIRKTTTGKSKPRKI